MIPLLARRSKPKLLLTIINTAISVEDVDVPPNFHLTGRHLLLTTI